MTGRTRLPEGAEQIPFGGFNQHVGVFYQLPQEGGLYRYCFAVEPRHMNSTGTVHGGMLMSFADIAMSRTARIGSGARSSTTVSLSCDFVAPGRLEDFIEARVRVTRHTRSVVFLMADLVAESRVLLTATGVWKIV